MTNKMLYYTFIKSQILQIVKKKKMLNLTFWGKVAPGNSIKTFCISGI